MKIRTKVTVVLLFITLLIWVTVLFAQNTYTSIHQEFEALEGDIIPGAIAMGDMENAANEAAHELMDYVVFGEEESKQIVLSATKDLEEAGLEHLEHETHIGQEEQKVAEELLVKINVFNSAVAELIDLKEQGVSVNEVLKRENETIHPSLYSLIEHLEEHKATHIEELAEAEYLVSKAVSSGVLILFLVGGLITLLAIAALWFISRSIVKPLHALHRGTEIIGQGNLDYKVGTRAKDEIGQLSRAFDQMTEDLGRTTTSIDNLNKEIAERKRAEEEIASQRKNLQDIMANMIDGVTICDMNGQIISINQAATEQQGYTKEEAIGKTPAEIFIVEEDIPKFVEVVKRLASGEIVKEQEYTAKHKDGRTFPVSVNLSALKDAKGKPEAIIAVHRDITERKQAEVTLRESEEKLRLTFESVPEGVTVSDLEGKIIQVNEATIQMHGYNSKAELIGRSSFELIAENDHAKAMENLKKAMKTGHSGIVEYTFLKADGSEFPAELNASMLRDTKGNPISLIAITRDITERKQAEEEREALLKDLERINRKLEESNRELQDFVYVASHDLREPLRKITSFGTLLQDSLGGKLDEDQQENFEFMIDGSKRMQTMIDDLLLYSRVTTKAKQFGQVNLNDVIEDLKSLELAALLDETRGTIHVPEMLPPVQSDSSQIHQLLQNLVANGLKFHREGVLPEITIRARRIENNMVRVEVQDNGIGIGKEYYEQVFTMFKRLHSRTEYKGTGIGLAVCKKIVQRHGGEIGVESTPGEGSIFWFTLPREAGEAIEETTNERGD